MGYSSNGLRARRAGLRRHLERSTARFERDSQILADEEGGATGFFIDWGPVRGASRGGRGVGATVPGRLAERSQFAGGGPGGEEVEVVLHGAVEGGFGLFAGAAEFGVGAVPGAFEGGDLALYAGEELGGGGLGEQGGDEGGVGGFGDDGAVEIAVDGL